MIRLSIDNKGTLVTGKPGEPTAAEQVVETALAAAVAAVEPPDVNRPDPSPASCSTDSSGPRAGC